MSLPFLNVSVTVFDKKDIIESGLGKEEWSTPRPKILL